jgi:hypothetical protein
MNFKVIEGHLTTREKKVVKYMLENKLNAGKAGKKNFLITKKDEYTEVKIKVIDRGLIPCPGSSERLSTYTHKIKITS